jgi:ankyrin repeat protein
MFNANTSTSPRMIVLVVACAYSCLSFAASPADELVEAAARGQLETVETILGTGLSVDAQRADGVTALYLASQQGQTGIVEYLLQRHARVEHRGK